MWQDKYDETFLRFPKQISHPSRKLIYSEVEGGKVLDVGCATCIDYEHFKNTTIKYVGIDITSKFVKAAKEYNPHVEVIHGDGVNLPFRDKAFETTYCRDVLEHLPPSLTEFLIQEMWRVVKKKMMIVFFRSPTARATAVGHDFKGFYLNRYNKETLIKLIKSLNKFMSLKIVENIEGTHTSLYIINKTEAS